MSDSENAWDYWQSLWAFGCSYGRFHSWTTPFIWMSRLWSWAGFCTMLIARMRPNSFLAFYWTHRCVAPARARISGWIHQDSKQTPDCRRSIGIACTSSTKEAAAIWGWFQRTQNRGRWSVSYKMVWWTASAGWGFRPGCTSLKWCKGGRKGWILWSICGFCSRRICWLPCSGGRAPRYTFRISCNGVSWAISKSCTKSKSTVCSSSHWLPCRDARRIHLLVFAKSFLDRHIQSG